MLVVIGISLLTVAKTHQQIARQRHRQFWEQRVCAEDTLSAMVNQHDPPLDQFEICISFSPSQHPLTAVKRKHLRQNKDLVK